MDTVNKKLTRSSGHRADFNRRRAKANMELKEKKLQSLKALLSGHGIRWGIRAERWERMWACRDVSRHFHFDIFHSFLLFDYQWFTMLTILFDSSPFSSLIKS